jgi:hypothetical protein
MGRSSPRETRRGRPLKGGVDEAEATQVSNKPFHGVTGIANHTILQTRRTRMRRAQKDFRTRRRAAQEAQERRLSTQDRIIEQMATTFMEFADFVLRSDSLRSDTFTVQKLRETMERFVSLGHIPSNAPGWETTLTSESDAVEDVKAYEQRPFHVDSDGEKLATADGSHNTIPVPQISDADDIVGSSMIDADSLPSSSVFFPPSEHHEKTSHELSIVADYPPLNRNIFGNGWLNQLPTSFNELRDQPRLFKVDTHPFAIKLLQYTLSMAYYALSSDMDSLAGIGQHMFRFALPFHSKEELLFNLRWFLGPGNQEIARLSYVSYGDTLGTAFQSAYPLSQHLLLPAVDTYALDTSMMNERDDISIRSRPFWNAQDVERYLPEKGARFVDPNTIEISQLPFGASFAERITDESLHIGNHPSLSFEARTSSHIPSRRQMDDACTPRGWSNPESGGYAGAAHLQGENADAPFGLWDFFSFNAVLGNMGVKPPQELPRSFPHDDPSHRDALSGKRTYLLRASLLFQNLARLSHCLTIGPGYRRALIDKAIFSAMIR